VERRNEQYLDKRSRAIHSLAPNTKPAQSLLPEGFSGDWASMALLPTGTRRNRAAPPVRLQESCHIGSLYGRKLARLSPQLLKTIASVTTVRVAHCIGIPV